MAEALEIEIVAPAKDASGEYEILITESEIEDAIARVTDVIELSPTENTAGTVEEKKTEEEIEPTTSTTSKDEAEDKKESTEAPVVTTAESTSTEEPKKEETEEPKKEEETSEKEDPAPEAKPEVTTEEGEETEKIVPEPEPETNPELEPVLEEKPKEEEPPLEETLQEEEEVQLEEKPVPVYKKPTEDEITSDVLECLKEVHHSSTPLDVKVLYQLLNRVKDDAATPMEEREQIAKAFYDNQGLLTLVLALKKYYETSRRFTEATTYLLLQILKYDERCHWSFVSCNGMNITMDAAKYLSANPTLSKVYDYYFDDRNMVQAHALLMLYKLKSSKKDKVSAKVTNVEGLDFVHKMLHRHPKSLPIQFASTGYLYEMCNIKFMFNKKKKEVLLDAQVDRMLLDMYHNFRGRIKKEGEEGYSKSDNEQFKRFQDMADTALNKLHNPSQVKQMIRESEIEIIEEDEEGDASPAEKLAPLAEEAVDDSFAEEKKVEEA